jgi:hypothetical protein
MKKTEAIFRLLALAALTAIVFVSAQPSFTKTVASPELRRTILLKFKAEASPAEIRKILREVKANISGLKGVRNVFVGAQVIDRIPFAWGISMDFDNEAALKAYRQDQEHRRTHNDYSHLIEQAQISDIRDE